MSKIFNKFDSGRYVDQIDAEYLEVDAAGYDEGKSTFCTQKFICIDAAWCLLDKELMHKRNCFTFL